MPNTPKNIHSINKAFFLDKFIFVNLHIYIPSINHKITPTVPYNKIVIEIDFNKYPPIQMTIIRENNIIKFRNIPTCCLSFTKKIVLKGEKHNTNQIHVLIYIAKVPTISHWTPSRKTNIVFPNKIKNKTGIIPI